jgi:hypothetical protein
MVGKRTWATANGTTNENGVARRKPRRAATETPVTGVPGINSNERPRVFRFKDSANIALEEAQREELKHTLLKAVDRDDLEKYRKSDEEVNMCLTSFN